jgi:SAM-dependent methyltransferase
MAVARSRTFSSPRGEMSGRVTVGTEGPPDRRSTADKEQAAKNQILALARELAEVCDDQSHGVMEDYEVEHDFPGVHHRQRIDVGQLEVDDTLVRAPPGFPDGFFDAVVAQYVITAVPDPEATLDEFVRVTRPGGEIILVNHLGVRLLERKAMPPLGLFSLIRFERVGKGEVTKSGANGQGR